MRHTLLTSAALTTLALAGAASAGGLVNGSFESPGGAGVRDGIGPGYVPGWTYVAGPGGSLEIYESDNAGDGLTAADGAHYVSFGHNGTYGGSIYQTLNTIIGDIYTVKYSVAEQQGVDPTQILRAIVQNGTQVLSEDNSPLPDAFAAGQSITFTATTDLTRLTFLDATPAGDGGGSNLALDAVSVSGVFAAGGAPEPAAWAMMLVGFGGLGLALRSRRREAAALA